MPIEYVIYEKIYYLVDDIRIHRPKLACGFLLYKEEK